MGFTSHFWGARVKDFKSQQNTVASCFEEIWKKNLIFLLGRKYLAKQRNNWQREAIKNYCGARQEPAKYRYVWKKSKKRNCLHLRGLQNEAHKLFLLQGKLAEVTMHVRSCCSFFCVRIDLNLLDGQKEACILEISCFIVAAKPPHVAPELRVLLETTAQFPSPSVVLKSFIIGVFKMKKISSLLHKNTVQNEKNLFPSTQKHDFRNMHAGFGNCATACFQVCVNFEAFHNNPGDWLIYEKKKFVCISFGRLSFPDVQKNKCSSVEEKVHVFWNLNQIVDSKVNSSQSCIIAFYSLHHCIHTEGGWLFHQS